MTPWLHYTPAAGWMNDPNGLVHFGGRHHLFYQYNPTGTAFANQHWGHASSTDLLTWTEHPIALAPGPEPYDVTACFSGCAVPHEGGVSFLYTGVGGGRSLPCLAHGTGDDLATLRKDPANPVVAAPPDAGVTEFRDHTAYRAGGEWWQLVAGVLAGRGATLFAYASTDLRTWAYRGIFVDGTGSGVPGAVWECPDLVPLPGGPALVVSVIHPEGTAGPDVWWMTGRLADGLFRVTASGPGDLGDRYYAPQSYPLPDGRRIQFGWVRTHLDPAGRDGPVVGALSLPRELSVRDGRLYTAPAAELAGLRWAVRRVPLRGSRTTVAPGAARVAGELVLDETAATGARSVTLSSDTGAVTEVDLTGFAGTGGELRLFWDAGIVEVFRGGLAGVWTDLRVTHVTELSVHADARVGGSAAVWGLARAGRRAPHRGEPPP